VAEVTKTSTVTLPSGVQYYDAIIGDGKDVVTEGRSVTFKWVLRRSNGYFVDSSGDNTYVYKVGNLRKIIKGLDEGIRGMSVGG
jgi:FKBP-type peptidyl-prolyl cis-trans isomerase